MIRTVVALGAVAALLAACSGDGDADEDSAGFRPPVVQARGDFMARQEKRFRRLDKDGDGMLVAAEYPRRRPDRVAALDANKDGRVSRSEFIEGNLARFDAMDANRDGTVTPDERRPD